MKDEKLLNYISVLRSRLEVFEQQLARSAIQVDDALAKALQDLRSTLEELESPGNVFEGYTGSCVDITDQKQLEASLHENQNQLASIIASAMDAIITVDSDQRIVLFNAAAEEIFGYPASEAIGKPLDLFIPKRFRAAHSEHIRNFGKTSIPSRLMGSLGTVSGLRAEGEEFPIEASISQVEIGAQKLFTVLIRDISRRMQDEDKFRQQAALLDQATDAIQVRDLEDHILFWNKGAERIYGWTVEEAMGRDVKELNYMEGCDDFYEAKRILLERGEWSGETHPVTKSGQKIIVENRWTLLRDREENPESILVINTDVTEKRKMEAQYLHAQHLEIIGTLAAGIAHDMGNIISPIMLATRLLRPNMKDDESEGLLSMIERNGQRGAKLLKQILGFAKGNGEQPVILQPAYIIREVGAIIKETFPKSIVLKSKLPDDLWSIKSDATQLNRVLMNLCINARDAMPRGGELTINAENIEIDRMYATTSGKMQAGPYILITVADTGSGIAAEDMDKIFEPFFTTKMSGEGTGLGLANVVEIIQRPGGFIDVNSEMGKGTEFKLYLPAVGATEIQTPEPEKLNLPLGRGELILVADDEVTILEITGKMLEVYGYRVLPASDGVETISLYNQNRDEIELVLLDMIMPFMDGVATIRTLKRLNPKVKIIASSGFSESLDDAERLGVRATILKPYTAQELLTLLSDVFPQSIAKDNQI